MPFIYKTLFEIKLTHEFYCTKSNGDSIFDLAAQSGRMNFLLKQFTNNEQSINTDIEFKFPEELESTYSNYHLKLLTTYSGCKVAVRVNRQMLPDNSVVFQPFAAIPEDLNIYILLSKKNNLIDSYTNSVLIDTIPFIYFFSNENIAGAKSFPFLTGSISTFDGTKTYNQGELALFGANDIREYYKTDLGDQWSSVTGTAFANENDRMLVSPKFYYSFNTTGEINEAVFTLKDKNANVIKTISVNSAAPIQKTLLDFSDKAGIISLPEMFAFSDVIYTLDVSAGNGYLHTHRLIFSNNLYSKQNWGVINIKPSVTNTSFNLFANDGFLIKRKNSLGVWDEAPVFEIPVKSRFTYWRYINEKGKELKLIAALNNYLFKEDKVLMSLKPRAIAHAHFLLTKEDGTSPKYFPNPVSYDIKKDSKERLCFDVRVPECELFPII